MTQRPCPKCQTNIDDQTCLTGDPEIAPKPGDYSLCAYCGTPLVFTSDLNLRRMQGREWDALDPDMQSHFLVGAEVVRKLRARMSQ